MKILGRLSVGAAALATLLGAPAGPARAHEKWFVGEPVGGQKVSASEDDPRYLVESENSGKEAAHKPDSLSKA